MDRFYSLIGFISNVSAWWGTNPGQTAVGGVLTAHFKTAIRHFELQRFNKANLHRLPFYP